MTQGWQGLEAIGSHPWIYPSLEVVHITGIALLLGNLVLLELRVWSAAAELPIGPLARWAVLLSLLGFGIVVLSGLLMFASRPAELLTNRAFVIKMGLVMLAGLNAAAFHARGGLTRLDATARAQTVLSLGTWFAAIICGRWIAYL